MVAAMSHGDIISLWSRMCLVGVVIVKPFVWSKIRYSLADNSLGSVNFFLSTPCSLFGQLFSKVTMNEFKRAMRYEYYYVMILWIFLANTPPDYLQSLLAPSLLPGLFYGSLVLPNCQKVMIFVENHPNNRFLCVQVLVGKQTLRTRSCVLRIFRSGRISSVYIVGWLLVGCWLVVTLFQNLFILSVVVL